MYNVQKSSFHIKRKFAAKSSEISPLLLFIACKNYHRGYLQKGGEAEVITGRAHAYTSFYQLTRPLFIKNDVFVLLICIYCSKGCFIATLR